MTKKEKCDKCGFYTNNLEECGTDQKVFLCTDCVSEWCQVWKKSGLELNAGKGHKEYNAVWGLIFQRWLKGDISIPTFEECLHLINREIVTFT